MEIVKRALSTIVTMTESPSISYSQAQVAALSDNAANSLEDLVNYFGLELTENNRMYTGSCPIHKGDNHSAFKLYKSNDDYGVVWKCHTRGCHETFSSSIIGLVRGLLSTRKYGWSTSGDEELSFKNTIKFLINWTSSDITNIKTNTEEIEKNLFSAQMQGVYNRPQTTSGLLNITRDQLKSSISIPADYYINRGFSSDILQKYDVGLCVTINKPMYNRNVVPIFSADYSTIVGCSGRSIFDKCPLCKCHHNPTHSCPGDKEKWKYCKWMHNKGFKAEEHLYNFWFAKDHIKQTKVVVLVESPGNVWKLEEAGIHNTDAMYGAKRNDMQLDILNRSGAMAMVILMDPDEAGRQATDKIIGMCQNTYQIYTYNNMLGDVADQTISYIKDNIQPLITEAEEDLL